MVKGWMTSFFELGWSQYIYYALYNNTKLVHFFLLEFTDDSFYYLRVEIFHLVFSNALWRHTIIDLLIDYVLLHDYKTLFSLHLTGQSVWLVDETRVSLTCDQNIMNAIMIEPESILWCACLFTISFNNIT